MSVPYNCSRHKNKAYCCELIVGNAYMRSAVGTSARADPPEERAHRPPKRNSAKADARSLQLQAGPGLGVNGKLIVGNAYMRSAVGT
jgi:hypothetical protein